jgi:hypothetical protein
MTIQCKSPSPVMHATQLIEVIVTLLVKQQLYFELNFTIFSPLLIPQLILNV